MPTRYLSARLRGARTTVPRAKPAPIPDRWTCFGLRLPAKALLRAARRLCSPLIPSKVIPSSVQGLSQGCPRAVPGLFGIPLGFVRFCLVFVRVQTVAPRRVVRRQQSSCRQHQATRPRRQPFAKRGSLVPARALRPSSPALSVKKPLILIQNVLYDTKRIIRAKKGPSPPRSTPRDSSRTRYASHRSRMTALRFAIGCPRDAPRRIAANMLTHG